MAVVVVVAVVVIGEQLLVRREGLSRPFGFAIGMSIAVEYRNEQKRNFPDTMTRFRATRIPREQVRNSLRWSG